jgi:hypothetical protein
MRTNLLAVLVAAFVLALAGTAIAQDNPTQDAYGGVLGNEVVSNDDAGQADEQVAADDAADVQAAATVGGSLPFTGFEVGLIALAGIGLVMLGVAMRRTSRKSEG